MITLLHCGDLHPNSKATFAGKLAIDPATGKNLSLTDMRRSLAFLIGRATAPKTRCDACVIPGDVFDSPTPTMDEVQIMVEWVEQMADEMPVLIVPGNHDMGQSGNMATALEPLKLRSNVFIMERPQSVLLDLGGTPVRFFGLPYPQKGRLLANDDHKDKSPEEVTALINQGLAAILRSFVLDFEEGVPNVLLAHGSVANAIVGDQPRSIAHDIFIPLDELLPFDYTALAHIHAPQQVGPKAWYCGSLVRASFGEEREQKGFNVVELHPDRAADVRHVRNPHARTYSTLTAKHLAEFDYPDGLQADMVWRFKDAMTDEEHHALQPTLDRLAASTPWFQVDIERVETTRARDAGMSGVLTTDEALLRALTGKVEEAELPALMEKHRALEQEVA